MTAPYHSPARLSMALLASGMLAGAAEASRRPSDEFANPSLPSILRQKICEPRWVRPWLVACGKVVYIQTCDMARGKNAAGLTTLDVACTWQLQPPAALRNGR